MDGLTVALALSGFRTLVATTLVYAIVQITEPSHTGCLPVDNVEYSVADQNIRHDDSGRVHVHLTILYSNANILLADGFNARIAERGGVPDGALNHVVLKYLGEGFGGKVSRDGGNCSECIVAGRKHGDVFETLEYCEKLSLRQSASNGSEIRGRRCGGHALWDHQDGINKMNNASPE